MLYYLTSARLLTGFVIVNVNKLNVYGVTGKLLFWIEDFLYSHTLILVYIIDIVLEVISEKSFFADYFTTHYYTET